MYISLFASKNLEENPVKPNCNQLVEGIKDQQAPYPSGPED